MAVAVDQPAFASELIAFEANMPVIMAPSAPPTPCTPNASSASS